MSTPHHNIDPTWLAQWTKYGPLSDTPDRVIMRACLKDPSAPPARTAHDLAHAPHDVWLSAVFDGAPEMGLWAQSIRLRHETGHPSSLDKWEVLRTVVWHCLRDPTLVPLAMITDGLDRLRQHTYQVPTSDVELLWRRAACRPKTDDNLSMVLWDMLKTNRQTRLSALSTALSAPVVDWSAWVADQLEILDPPLPNADLIVPALLCSALQRQSRGAIDPRIHQMLLPKMVLPEDLSKTFMYACSQSDEPTFRLGWDLLRSTQAKEDFGAHTINLLADRMTPAMIQHAIDDLGPLRVLRAVLEPALDRSAHPRDLCARHVSDLCQLVSTADLKEMLCAWNVPFPTDAAIRASMMDNLALATSTLPILDVMEVSAAHPDWAHHHLIVKTVLQAAVPSAPARPPIKM